MNETYYDRYWTKEDWPSRESYGVLPDELERSFSRWIPNDAVLLDAGCGDGSNSGNWLAVRVRRYVGVDISPRAVDAARARGLDARGVPDLASLPFPDAEFDACVAIEVLEHLAMPQDAVSELRRILKPGGIFIATVPNTVYWRRRLDFALLGRWHPGGLPTGARRPWSDPHLRFFTVRTLPRMLAESGFTIRDVKGINGRLLGDLPYVARRFGTERLSRRFRFLQDLLPAVFGANVAVVAEKPR